MRSLARLAFFCLLALAVAAAVADAVRSMAAGRWISTPLGDYWAEAAPASLWAAHRALGDHAWLPGLWDPAAVTILALPCWLVLSVLALLFLALARSRAGKDVSTNTH